MAYVITNSRGNITYTINENTIDSTQLSVNLVGRRFPGYGSAENENWLHLLENFAAPIEPNNPVLGQLWFDSANQILKVCNDPTGPSFTRVYAPKGSTSGNEPSNPQIGELFYNTTENKVKVWTGSIWQNVGPGDIAVTDVLTATLIGVTGSNLLVFPIGTNEYWTWEAHIIARNTVDNDAISWILKGMSYNIGGTAAVVSGTEVSEELVGTSASMATCTISTSYSGPSLQFPIDVGGVTANIAARVMFTKTI